ncbi:ABC transporter substrate-binding protein [Bradyrhizobium sp. UFLA05-112]
MSFKSLGSALLVSLAVLLPVAAKSETKPVRLAWCTSSAGISLAPVAAAKKFGWFEQEGLNVEIVNVATGMDCVTFVATGEMNYAVPSIEATAAFVAKGLKAKVFFTVYQNSPWEIRVPAESQAKSVADLKGRKIGVISLSAVGASVAKGLVKSAGLDPEKDVTLVAVGDAQRAAYFLRKGEIDAVSIFTLAHLQIENAGVTLRKIDAPDIDAAPSLGLIAKADYLAGHRQEAIGLARAYAKGLAFTFASPRAAQKVFYEIFPQALPSSKSVAEVEKSNIALTESHASGDSPLNGRLEDWGYSRVDVYNRYLATISDWHMINAKITAADVIDNSLIKEINAFDRADIARRAAEAATGN